MRQPWVVVEVGGEGIEASRQEVQVAAGTSVDVPVQVRAVERVVAPVVAVASMSNTNTPAQERATRVDAVPRSNVGPGAGPWVLMAVGGAAILGGGVLLLLGESARAQRDASCPAGSCPDLNAQTAASNAQDRYLWQNPAGIAALVVGGTIAAGGALWYALSPTRSAPTVRGPWQPRLGAAPGPGGFLLMVGGEL